MFLKEGKWKNNRGQVTIFIIVSLVVVAGVGLFFLFRNQIISDRVPSDFQNVYDDFVFCVQEKVTAGARTLESRGGYIYISEYEPSSEFMPFSSELDFLGNSVPYWYYVSGNNIEREKVPSKSSMENQLNEFLNNKISDCIPENFENEYELSVGEPDAKISIKQNEILANLKMDFVLVKGGDSTTIKNHEVSVDSDLGILYDNAVRVYNKEQEELFLENYAVDTLRLYAPVDGVDISCSPKIWNANEVYEDLKIAVEENTLSLKSSGEKEDYFTIDSLSELSNGVNVKFLNSKNWPGSFEVNPTDDFIMMASPVGNQQGLGILGFCYVPYHFVYSLKYPVMIQVFSENSDEVFQFPFAVIIRGNKPREPLEGTASVYEGPNICENKNTQINIRTYGENSNLIDSEIYYECFDESCRIGNSENGVLDGLFPQCANGYIIAKADGYKDAEVMLSTINSGSLEIFMDKNYEMEIKLNLDSANYNKEAVINFAGDSYSETIVYPLQDKINISAGDYEISVYIYENSSLKIGSSVQEYCTEVPTAVGGIFGVTKKECFDVNVPEQLISNALSGGGKQSFSFADGELSSSGQILINAESLPEPNSLEQIQNNYVLFDGKGLEVVLR